MNRFRLNYAPEGGEGGGGAAPAAPAASAPAAPAASSTPSSSQSSGAPSGAPTGAPSGAAPATAPAAPGAPSTDPVTGKPTGQPAAAGALAAPSRLIDTLPQRGTEEYWQKFEGLTQDQRNQLEREITDIDSGLAEPPKPKAEGDKPAVDPLAARLPGDKPAEGEADVYLDEAWVNTLPAPQQAAIKAMQETIDQVAPLMDETFGKGMEVFMSDPFIKNRMEEISGGNPWQPGELAKDFDPAAYIKPDEFQDLDPVSDPEGFQGKVGDAVKKAYEDGLKKGSFAKQYEMQQQIVFEQRKAKFDVGFNKLTDSHPELKSKDPSIKDVTDAKHPMNPFVKWVASNYRDEFFLKNENAFESAYAGFLAAGGKLNEAINTHVNTARLKFIRNLNQAQTEAATVGRNTSQVSPPKPQLIAGVDSDRYVSDPKYAETVYQNADWPTKQKLEQLRYGKLQPT